MKRASRKFKAHYFDVSNCRCSYKFKGTIYNKTLCNRYVLDVNVYTKYKNKVTCKKCIQEIKRIDKLECATNNKWKEF